ncbi:chromatin remodeling protein, putative [Medicago truncatula]|uniref:Chromatin remodeling protein, putative n=1 Tax=Medicago truncatula TaxID=3880 RepID=G7ZVP5_MEDTR|nr:chromatin remodeling protein, putative [Medicago truncatula]
MNAIKGVFCSSLSCEHDYRLNEEIGIYCTRCSFVKTEIKDITLHFVSQILYYIGL